MKDWIFQRVQKAMFCKKFDKITNSLNEFTSLQDIFLVKYIDRQTNNIVVTIFTNPLDSNLRLQ